VLAREVTKRRHPIWHTQAEVKAIRSTVDPADTTTVAAFLRTTGLAGPRTDIQFEKLTGGISSYIWKVSAGGATYCVKRARPQLAVAARWEVPVERNHFEAEYLRVASQLAPNLTPPLLGEDRKSGLLVMAFLDPVDWHIWKNDLLAGRADAAVAAQLATGLGELHCATAHSAKIARRFPTDDLFDALRLDPYLRQSGRTNPDMRSRLDDLIATTKSTKCVLVHGDVSPKNVLTGADGPRLLDAECAWYGDPAFDVAFCLNHFLLKMIHMPAAADRLASCFCVFHDTYLAAVDWEPASGLAQRIAHLLAGLLLARVDGKSPVEYLTGDDQKNLVRRIAGQFLRHPVDDSNNIVTALKARLTQ
jgi:aminoglycoside phosphotransferase (APT) family kinase protein